MSTNPLSTSPGSVPSIITVGHGRTPKEEFIALLKSAHVTQLVDVRTAPGSRRNPQFAKSELEKWLPESGIGYRWNKRFGGWRKLAEDSPDTAIRHPSFRAYARHMRTEEFRAGISDLLTPVSSPASQDTSPTVAIMCSETVWWRCHRRMIADYLVLARDIPVQDLLPGPKSSSESGTLPAAKLTPHPPMPAARVITTTTGRELIYDVADIK